MTPFMKLAIEIGDSLEGNWFCCCDLVTKLPLNTIEEKSKTKAVNFLSRYFMPNRKERNRYRVGDGVWLSEALADHVPYIKNKIFDNEFRIMVLLFADLMWQEDPT